MRKDWAILDGETQYDLQSLPDLANRQRLLDQSEYIRRSMLQSMRIHKRAKKAIASTLSSLGNSFGTLEEGFRYRARSRHDLATDGARWAVNTSS